jgi:hypothetical protein
MRRALDDVCRRFGAHPPLHDGAGGTDAPASTENT